MMLQHILHDHSPWLLIIAVVICLVGSSAGILLWGRVYKTDRQEALGWSLLSSIVLGATVWNTHFVAMLAYKGSAGATFDMALTATSIGVAVFGIWLAIYASLLAGRLVSLIFAGIILGFSIATMHFVGMLGFEAGLQVSFLDVWSLAATATGAVLGVLCVHLVRSRTKSGAPLIGATLAFSAAVASIHFTAMAAFDERHAAALLALMATDHSGLAIAVSIVTVLLIGTGFASYLLQSRLIARSSAELLESARTDPLTGVLNRSGFNKALADWCDHRRAGGPDFALLFVDCLAPSFSTTNLAFL